MGSGIRRLVCASAPPQFDPVRDARSAGQLQGSGHLASAHTGLQTGPEAIHEAEVNVYPLHATTDRCQDQ